MGDGAIAVALAGSIFFSIDPADARWRVALYLILTIAPFAVVTPLLGPAIDRSRGGRRGMIIGSLAMRALVAYFMSRHIDSLLLFPEAFAMLVLQKGYGVSRTALVPAVCPREDELIEANSKLALLSALGGLVGGATGVLLIAIFGNGASPMLAVLVFIAGVTMAFQLPQVQIAKDPVDATEKLEVRGANIILAATAIAVLRSIVGFTTFLLAFHLRAGDDGADITEPGALLGATIAAADGPDGFDPSQIADLIGTPGPPQWHLAAAGLAAGSGAILGARYAPVVRDRTTEERIVLGALVATATAAFLAAWGGGVAGTVMLAFGVGISAAMGKLGFDALVQRDAPRSNHGRAFAKFEGRFQLTWAIGAFVAVVIRFPVQLGALIVALAAGFAAVSYELGRRTDRVRRSSRVREAIRDRVPASAVERLGSNKALKKVRPLLDRISSRSASWQGKPARGLTPSAPPAQGVGERATTPSQEQLDKTIVSAIPSPRDPVVQTGDGADVDASVSMPIAEADWATSTGPQVSGDGVWVAPEDPPTAGPGDDGQYRLWE
ncbi:MAG: hypothetical protein ACI81L_001336 [Verrucomicrobiales bacterium]|jgi:hypothetical protein